VSVPLKLYGYLTEASDGKTNVRTRRAWAAIEVRFRRVRDWGTRGYLRRSEVSLR
jgi:hypothetical protein